MRTIIAGSRTFVDYELMKFHLQNYRFPITSIISGCAKGADSLGEQYAIEKGIPLEKYPANWNKYGKSAGYRRNEQMADVADALIAFWDGESKGTKHMIDIAVSKKLKVKIINYISGNIEAIIDELNEIETNNILEEYFNDIRR